MPRMTIFLSEKENDALLILAERERRDPRAQAAFLIHEMLEIQELLHDDDDISISFDQDIITQRKKIMIIQNDSKFDREEVRKMMEKATLSMTGHPVKIYLRSPIVMNWSGQAFRDRNGRFAFDIKPNLSLSIFYATWLHEACHIYCGHCDELPIRDMLPEVESNYSTNGPLIELSETEIREYEEDPKEVEARAVAHELDHFLEQAAFQRYGNREILSRLRVAIDIQLPPYKETP